MSEKLDIDEMIATLQAAIEAVHNLHKEVQGPYDNLICEECSHTETDVDFHTEYPCPTIKALEGLE